MSDNYKQGLNRKQQLLFPPSVDEYVDGAFLRTNVSKNSLIMKKSLEKDLIAIDTQISEYLKTLDYSDKGKQPLSLISKLSKDLRKLKYKKEELSENLKLLNELGKTQHNSTDKDATLMRKPAHNLMAYDSPKRV